MKVYALPYRSACVVGAALCAWATGSRTIQVIPPGGNISGNIKDELGNRQLDE